MVVISKIKPDLGPGGCYNIASALCFVWLVVFCCEACMILALQPESKPIPLALEGKVLTTGPPGKSLSFCPRRDHLDPSIDTLPHSPSQCCLM